MKTVVVIPTYDERENVARMSEAVLACGVEVLFVDDNSPDGTGDVLDSLAAHSPRVHVLHRERKEGLGRSHDPKDVPRLVAECEGGADLAIGSRYVRGGATPGWPLKRRLISRAGGIFIRTVTGMPFRDPTGGFKCWRRTALGKIDFATVASAGYSFQLEMNHRAWKAGLVVREIPIAFTDRVAGYSKITAGIAKESLKIAWRLRRAASCAADVPRGIMV